MPNAQGLFKIAGLTRFSASNRPFVRSVSLTPPPSRPLLSAGPQLAHLPAGSQIDLAQLPAFSPAGQPAPVFLLALFGLFDYAVLPHRDIFQPGCILQLPGLLLQPGRFGCLSSASWAAPLMPSSVLISLKRLLALCFSPLLSSGLACCGSLHFTAE